MILIPPLLKAELQRLPEYGMGYQIGRVLLNTGSYESGIILNGQYFIPAAEIAGLTLLSQLYEEIILNSKQSSLRIEGAKLAQRPASSLRSVKRIYNFTIASKKITASAAKDSEIVLTIRSEVFKRFSAYSDDFRITKKWIGS